MSLFKEQTLLLELLASYGIFSFAQESKIKFFQLTKQDLLKLSLGDSTALNHTQQSKNNINAILEQEASNTNVSKTEKPINITSTHNPLCSYDNNSTVKHIMQLLKDVSSLEELKNFLVNFKECAIAKTATNTVFGMGDPHAELLMIGEAPGSEEDLQGVPFVGKSGKLLNHALTSINIKKENIFTTNTVFWRPPGNRNPTSQEVSICRPFVQKIISLVKPKMILIIGKVAASSLLEEDVPISKLRGKWIQKSWGFADEIVDNINVRVVFHPAYLLRNPKQKKVFWFDLIDIYNKIHQLGLKV